MPYSSTIAGTAKSTATRRFGHRATLRLLLPACLSKRAAVRWPRECRLLLREDVCRILRRRSVLVESMGWVSLCFRLPKPCLLLRRY